MTPAAGQQDGIFVVVGGANTETIVEMHRPLAQGQKHTVTMTAEAIGGGGANQVARLRAAGHQVKAILPLGQDSMNPQWDDAVGGDCPRYDNTRTSHSIISLDERKERTILCVEGTAEDAFLDDCVTRTDSVLREVAGEQHVLMLGHIRRDAVKTSSDIVRLAERAKLRMMFPGRSQFEHCYHNWKAIWSLIDYWQLELSEARVFVQRSIRCDQCREMLEGGATNILEALRLNSETALPTADSVLRFFQLTRMTAVVTFNHKGAAAVVRDDGNQSVFIVFPYIVEPLKDPTGAGDAFGAGVARRAMGLKLHGKNPFNPEEFMEVLEHGTLWGGLACREYGGATNCLPAHMIGDCRTAMKPICPSIRVNIDGASGFLRVFAD